MKDMPTAFGTALGAQTASFWPRALVIELYPHFYSYTNTFSHLYLAITFSVLPNTQFLLFFTDLFSLTLEIAAFLKTRISTSSISLICHCPI